MKKFLNLVLLAALILFPVNSFAIYIGTYTMDVDATAPNWTSSIDGKTYRADYDAKVNPLGGINEVFCVEGHASMNGKNVPYDFYTIDDDLFDKGVSQPWISSLREATWYANWFVKSNQTENDKKIAQVAIWEAIGFAQLSDNTLFDLYDKANDKDAYTSNWLFAVNPSNGGSSITIPQYGQNYLVAAPVPEPGTMMLFGISLLGLSGVVRRSKK